MQRFRQMEMHAKPQTRAKPSRTAHARNARAGRRLRYHALLQGWASI
jgi:hypothetical protein